ncbi:hypothetical protein NC653_037421 [Populus alba x Populus x berolinensis]|uniref:Uncharacterized protein n=1 Tax=Populus alba x Populus x berolinensis TaxID=444605 RepID=A0AAD6LEH8_9ROSI|nr:hypothetical protein NC653_037421 [Populus alba x Populus x berolinensis]
MHDHARPACPPLFEEKSGAKSPVIASPILEFRDTSCGVFVFGNFEEKQWLGKLEDEEEEKKKKKKKGGGRLPRVGVIVMKRSTRRWVDGGGFVVVVYNGSEVYGG